MGWLSVARVVLVAQTVSLLALAVGVAGCGVVGSARAGPNPDNNAIVLAFDVVVGLLLALTCCAAAYGSVNRRWPAVAMVLVVGSVVAWPLMFTVLDEGDVGDELTPTVVMVVLIALDLLAFAVLQLDSGPVPEGR